jgi:MFS family permease
MNRNLLLLALCQGLFLTNNVTFIAINGLVGLALAPFGWMATLPVTGYVVGAALSAMPVARLQARLGRKRSFQIGLLVAMVTARPHARWPSPCTASGCWWPPPWWRASTAPMVRSIVLPGPSWWSLRSRSAPSVGCWPVALRGRSSGPTWPVPRALGWRCHLPGPIWRWWVWRCCRCWPCPSSSLCRMSRLRRGLRAAGPWLNCCGSRSLRWPSSRRPWAMA